MKFTKGIGILALGLTVSGAAVAQDAAVKAETVAPIKTLLPNAYGSVSTRHYTNIEQDDGETVNTVPQVRVHPKLGSTFFDGKLDSSFEWIFTKNADTTAIKKAFLVNYTTIKAVEGKLGNAGLYAETYQSNGQSFDNSYVGPYGELETELSLPGATLSLSSYIYTMGVFNSDKTNREKKVERADRTSNDSFGLLDKDAKKVAQRDPSIENWVGASATFKPAAVKGLSAGAALDLANNWAPKYDAVTTVDGDTGTEQDGYKASMFTMTRLIVGYKINDRFSVQNQVRHRTSGFYQEGIDASGDTAYTGKNTWQNRVYLNATLF